MKGAAALALALFVGVSHAADTFKHRECKKTGSSEMSGESAEGGNVRSLRALQWRLAWGAGALRRAAPAQHAGAARRAAAPASSARSPFHAALSIRGVYVYPLTLVLTRLLLPEPQICPELDEEQRCSMANITGPNYSVDGHFGREDITNTIDVFDRYTRDTLIQEPDTEFAFFDPKEMRCVVYPPKANIRQGCAPFETEAACSFACREYDTHKLNEALEEAEEEAVELGLFIFHFAIMFYMCLGLALVCEDFFVASLEIIIDKLQLPPDVAGATFMAAGSSSPELFVATVAVFAVGDAGQRCALVNAEGETEFALPCDTPEDSLGWLTSPDAMGAAGAAATNIADACQIQDAHLLGQKIYIDEGVGVGAVVGSTMFNTLCIIGGSAIVSGKISKLDWRIILRDGTTYMVAIVTLAYVLNMPDVEEHPVLAFFHKDSESCNPIFLTNEAVATLTSDHWPIGNPPDVDHKLQPKPFGYCGETSSLPSVPRSESLTIACDEKFLI